MPRYLLCLHEHVGKRVAPSPAEMQAIHQRYKAWGKAMADAGKMQGGNKLADEGGKQVRREGDKLSVQDGPYAEAREVLGGYYLLQAADYQEAVELAGSCPHLDFGWIEVREVEEMAG